MWSDNEALRIKMAAMKKLLDAAKPRIKDLRLASAKMQEDLLTLEYEITANT